MPIIRKVVDIGNSKAVFLPRSWVTFYEEETGEKMRRVTIEVNRILRIAPLAHKEKKEASGQ